ncbi:helix-turn-helix transcriptional regulator [Mycobacterium sp. IS-1496]|uniref:helix-turn-helix domain-containing protein n=1 Tax=Mycobacterium sp. IS-1496 TaxID=1772284 RepID=UPI001C12BA22|nr:helix-turn-helix transcriptional regulator [Mycobacterium sp. IS-1496]
MAGKEAARGPTGETVAARLREIRTYLNLTFTEVSERLTAVGWPISAVGVRRIEDGDRKVTVDDLVGLSVALGVSPIGLLSTNVADRNDLVTATGLSDPISAEDLWKWLRMDKQLGEPEDKAVALLEFMRVGAPAWRWEQFAEGAIALLELNKVERDRQSGDPDVREDAERRFKAIQEKYTRGDD